MASIGQNVARDGSIPPEDVVAAGASWIRIVAMAAENQEDYLLRCEDRGLKVLLVLARESFADGGTVELYRSRYEGLVDALQVGNEPDLESESSWTMTQGELASLGRAVRAAWPGIPIVCAGLASGQPDWLEGMDLSWCDAISFHPYLKDAPNPDDIEDLPDVTGLTEAYARFGKPLLITEWGWWSNDDEGRAAEEVRDMVRWAANTDLIEVFFYFCASDSMVPPFGLTYEDGTPKGRYHTFKDEAAHAVESGWPIPVSPPAPEPPAPPAWDGVRPLGVDVSSHQGSIDWRKVAASGVKFAFIKSTEGVNYLNPYFGRDWQASKTAGLYRGTYHYARPDLNRPDAEAKYFVDMVNYWGGIAPGDVLALDLEEGHGDLGSWAMSFLTAVELRVGFKPMLYCSPAFIREHNLQAPEFADFGLWLASWQSTFPAPVPPWEVVAVWQKSASGRIDGINGDVDVNEFNGPIESFPLYGKPGTSAPPTPPPPAGDDKDAQIAALTLALKTLRDDTLPSVRARLEEAERIVRQFVGND
jgi:GH25 family lysozyme M1 (1,4-beta-N-acetylmuramidase)